MAERLLKALGGVFLLVGIKLPIGRIKRLTMALNAAFFHSTFGASWQSLSGAVFA